MGILATGGIAAKMAQTLRGMEQVEAYAVASRSVEKARRFAGEWGFSRAYGSYEELLADENVDLIYVSTPHSHHYENAKAALLHGRPVLCEKAFTATADQAEELLAISREKKVFIAEAIWTRYMPMSGMINEILQSGIIGEPAVLTANLGYPLAHVERMQRPELAGGALLDLGVYALNFASMVFGSDVRQIVSGCVKTASGMDAQNSITLTFGDGRMAVLHSTMLARTDRQGIVSGDKGHLVVENINNPERITVVDEHYHPVAVYERPAQITGFEYQVRACMDALAEGRIESPYMPHTEILRIMRMMDGLRRDWGVRYPWDNW